MITEETALAILAGAYAISESARFRGATFVWDIHGNQGGPKEISFHKAADKLRALGDMAMKDRTSEYTNADRIRTLTNDELVDRLFAMYRGQMEADVEDLSCVWCDGNSGCINEAGEVDCDEDMHKACIWRWLQAPVKEEHT